MRDILIMMIVIPAALMALRRPWIGVLLWTWLSLMNPHRYAFGFSVTAPLAAIAAVSTLVGMLAAPKDRESPFKGAPPVILLIFMAWMTLSWVMGMDRANDYAQWDKVMKINLMVLVTLMLLRTRVQIMTFVWVATFSLALLGIKGGLFTIANGGNYRVWGPPGSFIYDNNHFALALVMTIPLMRFLQMQTQAAWLKLAMTGGMVLVAASALGSHSRGGFLAICAMTLVLWWRGRNRFVSGVVLAVVAAVLLAFMPQEWSDRIATIGEYNEDASAQGRLSAWATAWNAAFHYPFGVGFNAARPELFQRFSPNPEVGTPVAHSIYFQVLGQHGFVGLGLFLLLWGVTWRWAAKLRREARDIPQARWAADLGAMCQVSLVGYAVGGAFLNLAHFDWPYDVMAMVVMARVWVRRRSWETEPVPESPRRWQHLLGIVPPRVPAAKGAA
ncbi:putative O-glycosylation ligase, exosortase A system-associated [Rubrivivax benzoatilyticus]|uniref:O-glycosylation ligase, exosortase A system-associated n=1 Tax=Rubrivivax benzoatilyticus TaxID=316997 RepID=A0ABX0HYL0_9BURK|nr:putative O-glycosylation ligase, exosortase A system-associated [Rubrivivax benzoatilyticus]EGJ09806.1 hypothetical protein RBXJA2T_05733 [Rubrivivax benzoatilyticus JA2 = ATCC BAA-35]NHK99421.1 putative O-glycosylation ligase, exosortase A system-associated [Rubrivivax benzoatilyticus]NHL25295.1 putative O-glycosylation ligase, exosortase A system-associated [Rubrivivax benzoatilyticus]